MIPPKKIILISIDTLRADHLGCYGYKRNTSPNIDKIVKKGVLFKNAFSSSSFTIPSHASIFTSKYASKHSIGFNQNALVEIGKLNKDLDITLAEIFHSNGFKTAGFVSGIVLRKETNLNAGFEYYEDNIGDDPFGRRDGQKTNELFFEWISKHNTHNFFVFLHYFDVHGPYTCQRYEKLFLNDGVYSESHDILYTFDLVPKLNSIPNYVIANKTLDEKNNLITYEKSSGYYISQYDSCIRFIDDIIGELVKKLKDFGIFDDILIIITSDHGEALGENGIYFYHGLTVTLDQIKVPLIIKPHKDWRINNTIIEVPVSNIDIFPTLLSLGNIEFEDQDLDGKNLKSLIENQFDPLLIERNLMSENERQYALISPHGTMEILKKEIPTSTYYPNIPELIDTLHGKKFYWKTGDEYSLNLPFDEYQRYRIVADIIELYRKNDEKFNILDVGSGIRETLKKFLPHDNITNLDKEIPDKYVPKENFIKEDITKADIKGTYDFIISIDTYEHISPRFRERFLERLIKPSQIATIIASPFDTEGVEESEQIANNLYRSLYGEDYPWLKEHIQYGLPALLQTLDSIRRICDNNISIIPNGYLPRWFRIIQLYLAIEKNPDVLKFLSTLWEFYNKSLYEFDNCEPSYRKVIVISKSDTIPSFSIIRSDEKDPKKIKDLEDVLYRIIENIESTIKSNDEIKKQLNDLSINIREKENHIKDLSNQLRQENTHVKELSQLVADCNKEILNLNDQVEQVTAHAQGLSQLVADRDNEISNLTNLLQEVTAQPGSLENTLINQKRQIEALNKDINNVNLHAHGLEQLLSYRELQIAALTDQVQKIELDADGLEQSLLYRDVRIAALTDQIQQVTLHAQGLEQIIKENRSNYRLSSHFGLTERIIDASNYLINTCRNSCKFGLKALDILFHEGLRGLIKHYNDRKHIKKIETEHKIQSFGKKDILPIEKIDIKNILLPENNENPEVSIIIPVYNNVQYTLNCIRSISLNTKGPYEIIVVDDASDDLTPVLLKGINNLTIIKNEQNQGFIRSCNIGASVSKGNFILFLNNDTLVTENWLPSLLEIIKKEDVGAVGAKLVYPDGKLQEAGAIIWNDGSGWNYGRGENPEKPEYNFVRNVDYCSGAALLVKKEIFEKTGGFDELYIPAYYEDADLCFSIRKFGYKVIYQPKSVIIHFEGISNGSDIALGIKRNQIINKEKFLQKWKDILQKENLSPSPTNLVLARSRSSGKNILVIDQYVPFFDRDAGSYRMSNILKILAELGHMVTFIGENFNQFEPYDSIMQQAGIEVIFSPFIKSIEQYISQYGQYFDVVILSRPHITRKHISNIRKYCPNAKVVFDTVDLQFLRESRRANVINDPVLLKKADDSKKMEILLAKISDVTLVVSTKEQEILMSEDPSLNVQIISLIHELKKPDKTFSERRDLLFLGAFLHNPNVDGVIWFIKEIFPKIKSKIPDIKIFVVGDRPTKEVLSLSSEDIVVTGYVEDLTDYFNTCRVFVAPLRYGAGVKGKINQSMSHGLPVVTTNIGAEGLGITDEHNILVADDPELFSKKVIQLYQDEELWNKLSINSIEHIRQNFSYEKSKNRIKQFIDSL